MARIGLGGEHDEARGVVLGVLDIGLGDFQPVDLGGELGGDHGAPCGRRDSRDFRAAPAVSASITGLSFSARMTLRHWPSAMTWLCTVLSSASFAPGSVSSWCSHALEMLADDVEAGMRQQVMDVGDAAGHRILDRDHGELGLAVLHRGERVLEGRAGQRLHARIGVARGEMRVGAGLALKGDFVLRFGHGLKGRRALG